MVNRLSERLWSKRWYEYVPDGKREYEANIGMILARNERFSPRRSKGTQRPFRKELREVKMERDYIKKRR